jgi:hypothetical protein
MKALKWSEVKWSEAKWSEVLPDEYWWKVGKTLIIRVSSHANEWW